MTRAVQILAVAMLVLAVAAASSPWSATYTTTVAATAPALVGCSDTQATLRQANVGADCNATGPTSPDANTSWACYISAQDTVQLRLCCSSAVCTTASKTYYLKVSNP